MSDTDLPEWMPDEYDPDDPLVGRLPIMADIVGSIELHVQGQSGDVEVVGGPRTLENRDRYFSLNCGTTHSWEWEIVVPKDDDAHGPRLDRVDPSLSEPKYSATKDIAYLDNVDVRIYGVDTDRLQESDQ